MSARSAAAAAAVAIQEVPRIGTGLLLAVAATIVCPFDPLLAGMIRAGLGVEAVCSYLGLSRDILDYNLVRLDLPTPHDKPRPKGGRRVWMDDELRCAIYWRCLGIHPESIGIGLNRSTGAVRSKMRRIGVPAPDRKKLHKVDPGTLDRSALPEFGFPVPSGKHAPPPAQSLPPSAIHPGETDHNVVSTVPATHQGASAARPAAPKNKAVRKGGKAVVPGQRDLTLPSFLPPSKPDPAPAAPIDVAIVETPAEAAPEKPVAVCNAADIGEIPRVVGPADLIEQYRVAGKVRHPDANEAYLTWLTLLYRGGMHYKAIAAYVGRSASAVQAILYRMQIPRAWDRSKFGWTCDLECAVAELRQWKFELYRCTSKPEIPEKERPLFWRRKGATGNRRRRCARLKNKELDEYGKYKGGLSAEIMTRVHLETQRRASGIEPIVQNPSRLHVSMQGSLSIQQGLVHEQFALRGHAPTFRSGLPRDARDQMPLAYPRNGSAAQPVAHP
jgi:hypothetical protein